ncbi:hypothetical protein [Phenylobacterium hankyongense]|uniref:hypothetical protein n=1 Tax=Phenylobacterium hankyongense TaxID=1813876 RepID=UPI001058271F|nr:hypothetical protein [Phenylobacterium hankyongense]
MKKILLSLAAVAALGAAAAPAAAQPWNPGRAYDNHGSGQLTTSYVDSLDWKISNAAREGRISWQDARQLRGDLRQAQPIAYRVQTGEARGWERQRLQTTVSRIEQAVNGYGGRTYGYGYGPGFRR